MKVSNERDQLIQISAELRADLNRQQRLVQELMSQDQKAPSQSSSPLVRKTPARNLVATELGHPEV